MRSFRKLAELRSSNQGRRLPLQCGKVVLAGERAIVRPGTSKHVWHAMPSAAQRLGTVQEWRKARTNSRNTLHCLRRKDGSIRYLGLDIRSSRSCISRKCRPLSVSDNDASRMLMLKYPSSIKSTAVIGSTRLSFAGRPPSLNNRLRRSTEAGVSMVSVIESLLRFKGASYQQRNRLSLIYDIRASQSHDSRLWVNPSASSTYREFRAQALSSYGGIHRLNNQAERRTWPQSRYEI
ncbi:hypothetical protein RHIZ404_200005 [Rhizobium sp. EC-SD404]|nr:hypothetical protein RHIZ404_200005 [Rhizobium sp. EC-SD404]